MQALLEETGVPAAGLCWLSPPAETTVDLCTPALRRSP
jgi:hypothetical protein